jgi:hypothetical protein
LAGVARDGLFTPAPGEAGLGTRRGRDSTLENETLAQGKKTAKSSSG